MAEYINRDDLLKAAWDKPTLSLSVYDIGNIKPGDVAQVRHGRWLPFHSTAAGDIQYCSACEIGCTWKPNYCPNCGCRMDLEG